MTRVAPFSAVNSVTASISYTRPSRPGVLPRELVDNATRIARFEMGVFEITVTDLERRRYTGQTSG